MRRVLLLTTGIALFPILVLLAGPPQSRFNDLHRRLFSDQKRFQQLSQSAQSLLLRKFSTDDARTFTKFKLFIQQHLLADVTNVNVNDLSDDTTAQDTQSTSAIVLGSGSNVIAAFTDSGSFTGLNNHFTGFSSSGTGGSSFEDRGSLINSTEGDGGLPVLARSGVTGTSFLATLGFTTNEMIPVFRSTNNGGTFLAPVNATPGYVTSGDFLDKPWIAVDNATGSGQGNVYISWSHFPFSGSRSIRLSRSTDDGNTWGPNEGFEIATGTVQGSNVITGSDHSVFVFWYDQTANPRTIKMRRSTDQGATFGSTINVVSLLGTGNNGDLALNGGFATNSFPQAAANADNGHLYLVYNDDPAGVDRGNIFLRRSTDSGQTWNVIQINNDGTNNDQFHPSLAVTPAGSHLIVSWYDRRNDPANLLIERFAEIFSVDGAGNLNSLGEFPVTSAAFPPVVNQDPEVTPVYMGEYDQTTADNSFFYIVWGDNREPNAFHPNQPDVMFAKIPVNGPGAILDFVSAAVDDSTGNDNGGIDSDECFLLNASIRNNGTENATGITATLSTTTPDVTITQSDSLFSDLAPGGTGQTLVPFQIETESGFACGTADIDFLLTLNTSNAGSFQIPIQVQSGSTGVEVQFDHSDPEPIPDFDTVDIPIVVSGIADPLASVRVSVQITHSNDSDLDIYLIGPDGTQVELSTDNGGSSDNYGTNCSPQTSRTTFNQNAALSITSPGAVPPYAGSFKPEGDLSLFRGLTGTAVNGTWLLRVTDDAGIDTGTVNCVSLFLSPVVCTPGNGACGCPVIAVLPETLPAAAPGVPYNEQLSAPGGAEPYTFAVTSGTLPNGITISSGGLLSGTATSTGIFNITVTATDNNGCVGTINYQLVVECPTILISPGTLPNGVVNQNYSQQLTASGGSEPYVFAVSSGSLPGGVTLGSTGLISGTPDGDGLFTFAVSATDNFGCASVQNFVLTVDCPAITMLPSTLADAIINAPYNETITANGGTAPYTFAIFSGTLPAGISFGTDGSLTGTPTALGVSPFTVEVTDSSGCTASTPYTLNVVEIPCLFCDDFEDGVLATDWNYLKNSWNETGGELIGDPDRRKAVAIASPAFSGCTNCVIDATMASSGGDGNRVWLLGWYLSKRDTIELMMKEENDRWVLKQRSGGVVVRKARAQRQIDPNVAYQVTLRFNGSLIEVAVDGETIISVAPGAPVPNGTVGFQSKNTIGRFGEIIVN